MADDSLSKLLQTSIEQHDRAVRWSWLLLAVLVAFHLTTFERFVATSHEMVGAEEERAALAKLADSTAKSGGELKQQVDRLRQATNLRVESEFQKLRERFALLNLDVAEILCRTRAQVPADYGPCIEPAKERAGLNPPQMQMQMNMPPPTPDLSLSHADPDEVLQIGGPLELHLLPEELKEDVAALADDYDAILTRLEPVIESRLIEPAFANLNAFWRNEQLPPLATVAERNLAVLDAVAGQADTEAAAARRSIEAVRRAQADAEAVRFAPPEEPRWWLFDSGKVQASLRLAELAESVADAGELIAVSSIDDLLKSLNQAEGGKTALLDDLATAMARLEADFEAQREQLGALLEPLKAVAVDLAFFCRHFVLIIALAGAAALVWPAEKLRVARLTAAMAEAAGQDVTVWRWFEARRQGLPSAGPARLRPYLLAVVLVAWALYGAQRLTLLKLGVELWVETVLALAILLGAGAWRWQALQPRPMENPA